MSQMERFGEALRDYANGREPSAYASEFTKKLALDIAKCVPAHWEAEHWTIYGTTRVLKMQRADLGAFGVSMDTWFHESDLFRWSNESAAYKEFKLRAINGHLYQVGNEGKCMCAMCATELVKLPDRNCCEPCPHCCPLGDPRRLPPYERLSL